MVRGLCGTNKQQRAKMQPGTKCHVGQRFTDSRRMAAVLVLIALLELGIGIANSAFHWHSRWPLYAAALFFLIGIALAALYARQAGLK